MQDPEEPIKTILYNCSADVAVSYYPASTANPASAAPTSPSYYPASTAKFQHCVRCSYHDISESFYSPPYHKFAAAATISPPRISFTPSTFNTSMPLSILCQSIIEILLSL
ncbi:hypothetical protein BDR07DRAFT_1422333, partial [Suillus spraguei]